MKRLILLFCALVFLAGCAYYPNAAVYTRGPAADPYPTAPPSTLQTVSSSAIYSLVSHKAQYGTVSDDQLVLYAQSLYSRSDLQDASFISVRDIRVDGTSLLVLYDSAPGLSAVFLPSQADDEAQAARDDVLSAFRAYYSEMSSIFRDSCVDMGREELDGVVLLMSDEDPSIPLMGAINGVVFYDGSTDLSSDAAFDPARYPVNALAAAIGAQAEARSDDDFTVSDFRVTDLRTHGSMIVLDIDTPSGLRAYVDVKDPDNYPSWKTYRRVFANFTRSAYEYCSERGRDDVSVIVRVLNDVEPVDPLIVACNGEITEDNTLWRTLDGWRSLTREGAAE